MIKPSHYDDHGYPIQWFRSAIPSNTLACLNGLAEDARQRQVLGPGVELRLHTYDERTKPASAARPHHSRDPPTRRPDAYRLGWRPIKPIPASNRSRSPVPQGRYASPAALRCCPSYPRISEKRRRSGFRFFVGEAEEGRLDQALQDAWNGELAPIYNYIDKLPALTGAPRPFLPPKHIRRTSGSLSSVDLGRGCPYQCSFCTIINVQGRKSRFRSPDDLEQIVRENDAEGIHRFFITDDNFARNRDWEALFDRLIALRTSEFTNLGFTIQVDTHSVTKFRIS